MKEIILMWRCLAFMLVMLLVNKSVAQDETVSTSKSKISIHTDNETMRWRTSTGVTDFNIEIRGKIDITDDDKDIKSISDDGYLEITKTVFGSKRAIIIESLGGGKVKKEYYEGRTKMEWNPNGQQWLGEILPEIVRSTTLAAESRVNRLYKQGGTSAILAEIDKIQSDYVKSHYGKILLSKDIPSGEMATVITRLSNTIHSDYYLSNLLQSNIGKMLATQEAADAFFKGSQRIGSDYYKSVVLKDALKKYAASPNQVKVILNSASTINSAYYLSVVLTTLLEQPQVREESITEMINISKHIDSDYYRTQVLGKALQKEGLPKTAMKEVVSALADVNSDYYKTSVCNTMAEKTTLEPEVQTQVINLLTNSVHSDYYATVTLKNMLEHQKLSDDSFNQLVAAVAHIDSDNYASDLLTEAAQKDLNKNQLTSLLKAAENIDSDHYLSQVLINVAPRVKESDQATKDLYRQVAKKIQSDTYYGRAVKAID